jgi:hypothetical protein
MQRKMKEHLRHDMRPRYSGRISCSTEIGPIVKKCLEMTVADGMSILVDRDAPVAGILIGNNIASE